VHPGATSLLLAVLAEASKAGSWCAVVGVPTLNAGAAAELGVVLDRLALVPNPGPDWPTVVAALLDGFDIVVAGAPGTIAPGIASRLAARARQRGAVLMPYGAWPAVDLTLDALDPTWHGIESGRGRLRGRQLTVTSRGRGAASAPRLTHLWLPQPSGVLLPPSGELHPTEPPPLRLAGTGDRPAARAMAELRLAGSAPPASGGEGPGARDTSPSLDGEGHAGPGEALATVHRLSPGAWAEQNEEAG
jgi:hypothetical protein